MNGKRKLTEENEELDVWRSPKICQKKAGYSLRGLSDALDSHVTAQALKKYERGARMPNSGVLIRLAKILGVSLEYLLSEQVEEEQKEIQHLVGVVARESVDKNLGVANIVRKLRCPRRIEIQAYSRRFALGNGFRRRGVFGHHLSL